MTDSKIIVIGAGAWGTALANLLAKNSYKTCLISNDEKVSEEINHQHSNNKFLAEISLSYNLKAATNLVDEIKDADFVFIVTPSNATAALISKISSLNLKSSCGFILCTKGLDQSQLKFFHEIIEEKLVDKKYAILSGPNFAIEVASKVPSLTTIASKDKAFAEKIIHILHGSYFKGEFCDDVITTEISSVVKNIIAIGCGIIDGLALGENTKAGLVRQGCKEIELLSKKLGGSGNLNSAAGFGDIFLTCSTTKSRNNSLGFAIAKGEKTSDLLGKKTYEGAVSAKSIQQLGSKLELRLPLCEAVSYILQNNLTKEAILAKIVGVVIG